MLVSELKNEIAKVLEDFWCLKEDVIQYKIQDIKRENRLTTKTDMPSRISRLFDPLDLARPKVVKTKI